MVWQNNIYHEILLCNKQICNSNWCINFSGNGGKVRGLRGAKKIWNKGFGFFLFPGLLRHGWDSWWLSSKGERVPRCCSCLGQEQMSPKRGREAFSLPGLCSLPGSLADRARATRQHMQPLLDHTARGKMSDGYCAIYFTYCVGRDMKKKE